MDTNPNANYEAALDRAVAVMMKVQRDRKIEQAARELGISREVADQFATSLGF